MRKSRYRDQPRFYDALAEADLTGVIQTQALLAGFVLAEVELKALVLMASKVEAILR